MKIPAMPCVSQGMCCENHVVGASCGTIGGAAGTDEPAAGAPAGTPRGNAVARAGGTGCAPAVATIKRGFIAASSLRPRHPNGLHRCMTPQRRSEASRVPESRMYGDPFEAIVPIKKRGVWRELARSLSTIFNPFLTAFALFVILADIGAKDTLDFWRLLFVS